jgi:protein TonB
VKRERIDEPGYDDLIFAGRNKEYGAYAIRKAYGRSVLFSLAIALVMGSLAVVIPYLRVLRTVDIAGSGRGSRYVSIQAEEITVPDEPLFVPPSAPRPPEAEQIVKYVAPEVVDTVPLNTNLTPSTDQVLANPVNDNEEVTAVQSSGDDELMGDGTGEGNDEPFIFVEERPTFMGGDLEKFRGWVQRRVVYPKVAEDNGIEGKVFLTFIVERDGSVTNVQIVKGVDKLLDDEAKRAIEASPKWAPGLQRGRPVRVRFSIFLNFSL